MTRKHFVALAAALAETGATIETCCAVANVCAGANNNFDLVRFLEACGHPQTDYTIRGGHFGPQIAESVR